MRTPLFVAYTTISRKKHTGGSAVGPRPAQLLRRPVEQGDPLVPQQFGSLALGLLPGGQCLLDQPAALGGEPERLGTGVLVRDDLQPAVGLQRLDVAAE